MVFWTVGMMLLWLLKCYYEGKCQSLVICFLSCSKWLVELCFVVARVLSLLCCYVVAMVLLCS